MIWCRFWYEDYGDFPLLAGDFDSKGRQLGTGTGIRVSSDMVMVFTSVLYIMYCTYQYVQLNKNVLAIDQS